MILFLLALFSFGQNMVIGVCNNVLCDNLIAVSAGGRLHLPAAIICTSFVLGAFPSPSEIFENVFWFYCDSVPDEF